MTKLEPRGKGSETMTVKELQKYIRETTADVNVRIDEYRNSVDKQGNGAYELLERHIDRLKEVTGSGRMGELGLHFEGKNKAELEYQLKLLKTFNTIDRFTPTALQREQEKVDKAYSRYIADNGYISRDDYEIAVHVLGNVSSSILSAYGSTNILELVRETDGKKTANEIREVLIDAYDNAPEGATSNDILFDVYARLRK